ncbi:GTP cyclohydrolase I FolE [Chondrinema litorale]|uniref:GTP cyclohydrolase I FolE n=1 Tax=Chondrinema litorale TaxID=2994555 RepID=UPI00254477B3|nr:GTP cyclohydrolase I FolE [Chondrinema litorale]UZR93729.1 GTP cyclohydrolase I FolE [Chondrinema litorale]
MKQNGTSLNTLHLNGKGSNQNVTESDSLSLELIEQIGDEHVGSSYDTPLRKDAFELSDDEKMRKIEHHFKEIMETLGLDLTDDSLKGTPHRVAKMYVKEIFNGLDPKNFPAVKLFDNKYKYNEMLVEKDISFNSNCEHHFVPIIGKAHVAYISNGKVIGLSKINRIVQYFAKRPQVQERLTVQIAETLKKVLETEDIAIVMDAKHMCVSMRGVEDHASSTVTSHFSGKFKNEAIKSEFLKYIQ